MALREACAGPADLAQHRRISRATRFAIGVVAFLAVAVAQLFRQSGVASWRTVWAEDGGPLYDGTESVTDLFKPYGGYAPLTSRSLGLLAHLVPVADLARYYAVMGALVTTLAALAVWYFTSQLVRPWPLRLVLSLSVAFLPVLMLEQIANGVNTLWAVLFAGWWALLYRPTSWKDAVPAAAVACLAALSSGLALLYAPMALLLVVTRRDTASRLVLGAYAVGAAVQTLVALTSTDNTPNAASHVGDLPRAYSVRVLGSALVGEQWLDKAWNDLGRAFAFAAVIVVVAVVVVLAVRSSGTRRWFGLITLGYSIVLYVVPVWIRGTDAMRVPDDGYFSSGNRYASLSIWFLLSGIALLASADRVAWVRSVVAGVLVAQFLVIAVAGYRLANPRSNGPSWAETVAQAREQCDTQQLNETRLEVIPPGPFPIVVSCSKLRE